ncbi:Endonuclease/exonuclease/phosphatase, partial [Pilaira anomala]
PPLSLQSSMSALQPYTISLWNANGLRMTTIQDSLSYVSSSHILFITETWLTSPMLLPTNWAQYHLYGTKIPNANNRGKGGIVALVNPSCPLQVTLLPSPNAHTLSIKVGVLRVHCVYLPPSLKNAQVVELLESIPLGLNTIICGDFNSRLGGYLGDYASNSRGRTFLTWVLDNQMSIMNSSLALGIPTFSGYRRGKVVSSVIDLFVTNLAASSMLGSYIHVESELSLGSDHRLLTLSFELDTRVFGSGALGSGGNGAGVGVSNGAGVSVRRLWNLSRLGEKDVLEKYRSTFGSLVAPLQDSLSDLVSSPPSSRPEIDDLNDQLLECVYS